MNKRFFYIYTVIFILVSAFICIMVANGRGESGFTLDATKVNRRLAALESNWDIVSQKRGELISPEDGFDYTVIGNDGTVYMMTRSDMAQSVSSATTHYDVIRNIRKDGETVGILLIHNPVEDEIRADDAKAAVTIAGLLLIALMLISAYQLYMERNVIRPFSKMKSFAGRIASGNLDTPLEMDRGHIFGEFTEAFDIMREELKSSREREETAIRSRKELIAELSHDIKTPVASIKAMADVMELSADTDSEKETARSISGKADQIDRLISDLFHATMEELEQLKVNNEEFSSEDLQKMIREADHLHKVNGIHIEDAVLAGDELRMSQVITNIIYNSYKYAGTEININTRFEKRNSDEGSREYYVLEISDLGGGVQEEELELITEKFKRGSNAGSREGSGLGLYISKYLMEKMGGGLACSNDGKGLKVALRIRIA